MAKGLYGISFRADPHRTPLPPLPPKSITTSENRKHTTQISTVYKQCVHCRSYFPSLYFLFCRKEKEERKITIDPRVVDGRTGKLL
jgi:hypothetical protein